jgi:hypothetical protein
MKEKEPTDRNARLREVLRRGDPGGNGAGLTSEEAQAMRRTVLSAVPEPKERFRLAPVFFTAAAMVLSCVVGLSLWRAHDGIDHPVPPVQSAVSEPSPAPQAVRPAEPHPETSVAVAVVSPQAPPRTLRSTRPRDSVKHPSAPDRPVEEVKAEEPRETTTRQVQFSAPGGTRIIWLLTESSKEPTDRHRPDPVAAEGD